MEPTSGGGAYTCDDGSGSGGWTTAEAGSATAEAGSATAEAGSVETRRGSLCETEGVVIGGMGCVVGGSTGVASPAATAGPTDAGAAAFKEAGGVNDAAGSIDLHLSQTRTKYGPSSHGSASASKRRLPVECSAQKISPHMRQ